MKSKVLLLGAVVTAFAITSFAAEPLLSPRAAGNQIKIVKSSAATPTVAAADIAPGNALFSPRAQGNQIKVASGLANGSNPSLACRSGMTGSPKAVGACADNPNHPACNSMTVAQE